MTKIVVINVIVSQPPDGDKLECCHLFQRWEIEDKGAFLEKINSLKWTLFNNLAIIISTDIFPIANKLFFQGKCVLI